MSKLRILLVCEGNTCRSPMAQAIAQGLLGAKAQVESAGIETANGMMPAKKAVSVMREMGLDISRHRTRSITNLNLDDFDIVVAMTDKINKWLKNKIKFPDQRLCKLDIKDPLKEDSIEAYRECARNLQVVLREMFNME